MKRIECWSAPDLDQLLELAVGFDQGNLPLDPYEAQELFNCLLGTAQLTLHPNSALRLASVSLERDHQGICFLRLKRRQMVWQGSLPVAGAAA